LAVCDRESRDALVIQSQCPAYERAKVGSIMLVIAMGIGSFIVFSMITFFLKKMLYCATPCRFLLATSVGRSLVDECCLMWAVLDLPAGPTTTRRPPRSPRGPQLTLSGWKSMREKLIETEHGNETPSAEAAGVMRIQLSAAETMSVIVEEGDGFRPASPSEHYRSLRSEEMAPALAMLR